MRNVILQGDIREVAKTIPAGSVNCIVTSPPYFGLRDYLNADQIGLEQSPAEYVQTMVSVFRELRRVLRDDGTVWLNLGDSFASNNSPQVPQTMDKGTRRENGVAIRPPTGGLPPKNLLMIPARVAIALQDDGWILRRDIIWAKDNPMPESVTDRPTTSHEYIFLLTKQPRYWYDAEAIAEPGTFEPGTRRRALTSPRAMAMGRKPSGNEVEGWVTESGTRNKRSVWHISTQSYSGSHFATFPEALVEPCIRAGCPAQVCAECGKPWVRVVEKKREYDHVTTANGKSKIGPYANQTGNGKDTHDIRHGVYSHTTTLGFRPTCSCNAPTRPGVVLDPFFGSGTVGQVAIENGRDWLGVELNPDYIKLAEQRLAGAQPVLFVPEVHTARQAKPVQEALW